MVGKRKSSTNVRKQQGRNGSRNARRNARNSKSKANLQEANSNTIESDSNENNDLTYQDRQSDSDYIEEAEEEEIGSEEKTSELDDPTPRRSGRLQRKRKRSSDADSNTDIEQPPAKRVKTKPKSKHSKAKRPKKQQNLFVRTPDVFDDVLLRRKALVRYHHPSLNMRLFYRVCESGACDQIIQVGGDLSAKVCADWYYKLKIAHADNQRNNIETADIDVDEDLIAYTSESFPNDIFAKGFLSFESNSKEAMEQHRLKLQQARNPQNEEGSVAFDLKMMPVTIQVRQMAQQMIDLFQRMRMSMNLDDSDLRQSMKAVQELREAAQGVKYDPRVFQSNVASIQRVFQKSRQQLMNQFVNPFSWNLFGGMGGMGGMMSQSWPGLGFGMGGPSMGMGSVDTMFPGMASSGSMFDTSVSTQDIGSQLGTMNVSGVGVAQKESNKKKKKKQNLCDFCHKSFSSSSYLRTHRKVCKERHTSAESNHDDDFECDFATCHRFFENQEDMWSHFDHTHRKRVVTDVECRGKKGAPECKAKMEIVVARREKSAKRYGFLRDTEKGWYHKCEEDTQADERSYLELPGHLRCPECAHVQNMSLDTALRYQEQMLRGVGDE